MISNATLVIIKGTTDAKKQCNSYSFCSKTKRSYLHTHTHTPLAHSLTRLGFCFCWVYRNETLRWVQTEFHLRFFFYFFLNTTEFCRLLSYFCVPESTSITYAANPLCIQAIAAKFTAFIMAEKTIQNVCVCVCVRTCLCTCVACVCMCPYDVLHAYLCAWVSVMEVNNSLH